MDDTCLRILGQIRLYHTLTIKTDSIQFIIIIIPTGQRKTNKCKMSQKMLPPINKRGMCMHSSDQAGYPKRQRIRPVGDSYTLTDLACQK